MGRVILGQVQGCWFVYLMELHKWNDALSESQQRVLELTVEALGYYSMPDVAPLPEGSNEESIGPEYAAFTSELYYNYRKISIYGGSNEIQRNIVAKAVLGF